MLPAPIIRTAGAANAVVGTNRRRSLEGLLTWAPQEDEPDKHLPMRRHPRVFKRRVGYHPKTLGSTSALVIHEDTTRAPLCVAALGQSRKPPSLAHDTRCCGTPPTLALMDPNSCTTTTPSMGPLWGGRLALTHHHPPPPPPHPPFQHTGFASHCRNSAPSRPGVTGN